MYLISVDAGGTKTKTAIVNKNKEILFEYVSGAGNIAVNFQQAKDNILEGIHASLASPYGTNCGAIVIGVAGAGRGSLKENLQIFLEKTVPLPFLVISDAELAYYSVFQNMSGILVIAGTGSILLTRTNNKFRTLGGWGHLLGDEGSAYDIGIQALKIMIKELEEKGIHSPFAHALAEKYDIGEESRLKEFVYSGDKAKIARIAYTVYQLAKSGDPIASALLKNAGTSLAKQVLRFIKILQIKDNVPIACKGSLLEKNEIVFQYFKETLLKDRKGQVTIVEEKTETVTGAIVAWSYQKEG